MDYNEKIGELLFSLKRVSENFRKTDKYELNTGFNAFMIASEYYYMENFHSYIIKALIDPSEKHKEKAKFLFLFIDMINKVKNVTIADAKPINKYDFTNSKVYREKEKIDILIISDDAENQKKAIIIENKINKAVDQPGQLPNYFSIVERIYQAQVVAIIYLVPYISKQPDKTSWSKDEVEKIDLVLKIIPAWSINYDQINLLNHWINPAILACENIDALSVLRQYGNLLKYLMKNRLDMESMEQFYNKLFEKKENFETALSIQEMLKMLPYYLAVRLEDRFLKDYKPFEKVWIHNEDRLVFSDFVLDENVIRISIWCGISASDEYKIYFYDVNGKKTIKDLKERINSLSDFIFVENDNSFVMTFNLFQENELIETIKKILYSLSNLNIEEISIQNIETDRIEKLQ